MEPKSPADAELAAMKRALRARFTVRRATAAEVRRQADVRWARGETEVLDRYRGEFVVPYRGRIVAHGHDAAAVRASASRATGQPAEGFALVGIIDLLIEMPF